LARRGIMRRAFAPIRFAAEICSGPSLVFPPIFRLRIATTVGHSLVAIDEHFPLDDLAVLNDGQILPLGFLGVITRWVSSV